MTEPHKYDAQGIPLATVVGPDPGNTDPDDLTAPLDPDDDVYATVNETTPAGENK